MYTNECLNWYTRSPQSYYQVRSSGLLMLPPPSQLILYKNKINQCLDFQTETFEWMWSEADRLGGTNSWFRRRGFCWMKCPFNRNLKLNKRGSKLELVGFVDMGEKFEYVTALKSGTYKRNLAPRFCNLCFKG